MKAKRIYIVGVGQTVRLVKAAHRAQALAHVARSLINVKVANQEELVEAVSRGIAVEHAAEDQDTNDIFANQNQDEAVAA